MINIYKIHPSLIFQMPWIYSIHICRIKKKDSFFQNGGLIVMSPCFSWCHGRCLKLGWRLKEYMTVWAINKQIVWFWYHFFLCEYECVYMLSICVTQYGQCKLSTATGYYCCCCCCPDYMCTTFKLISLVSLVKRKKMINDL